MQSKLTRRGFLAGACACTAAAATAATLSGCSSNTSPSSSTASASPTSTSASTPADEIAATLSYTSNNCNPIGNSTALFLSAGWHVFEGLYEIDFHDYSVYNALAATDPVKMDEVTYKVTLRDGARFSNGEAVTSSDVVNAFERNLADGTYSSLLPFLKPGSVTANDDKTIIFKLSYPFESLLKGRLALVKIFPATMTDDQLSTMPVGTGPWMYDSINGNEGGTISFIPNENYNGPFPATCKSMTWSILADDALRTATITSGNALAIENAPTAGAAQIANSGATVEDVPSFSLPFLMFNCAKAPFNDRRVRQALFYAIDTEKLIASAMGGQAAAATSFLPEFYRNYHRASTVYTYDPQRAQALLKEAGQEGLSFEFRTNSNWVQSLVASIMENWEAIGLSVTNKKTQGPAMFSDLTPSDAENGTLPFDVILSPGDPTCFGNDTDLLLSWWYDSPLWMQGCTCWAATSECQRLQALLQQAREATDSTTQQQIWNKCFDIVAEQAPLYPLFHREVSTAYIENKLEGFSPIATTGLLFLNTTPIN